MRPSLLVALFLAVPLAGQDLVTDRPDQTESAVVVPRGLVQLELGMRGERLSEGALERNLLTVGAALLRIGVLPWAELRLGFDGWQQLREIGINVPPALDGTGDLTLGAKVVLASRARLSAALIGTGSLTTGSDAFGAERVDPEIRLALATPLGGRLSLGVNAGAFWTTSGGATRTDALYTAVVGAGVSDRVGLFVEGFGSVPVSANGAARHSLDGGVTLLLAPTLQLDAAAGIGLNAAAAAWFIGVGASARVPR